MKSFLLIAAAFALTACASSQPTVSQNAATAPTPQSERPQTVTAHSTENKSLPASNSSGSAPGKWSSSGDPIDTAKFDGTIAVAEKAVKAKSDDAQAKKDLAQAYYDRGSALTEARQYASALGDYRRALKHDPSHEEAKNWIDQITGIYKMLKKDPPKEGEEPPPMPFKKT